MELNEVVVWSTEYGGVGKGESQGRSLSHPLSSVVVGPQLYEYSPPLSLAVSPHARVSVFRFTFLAFHSRLSASGHSSLTGGGIAGLPMGKGTHCTMRRKCERYLHHDYADARVRAPSDQVCFGLINRNMLSYLTFISISYAAFELRPFHSTLQFPLQR